MKKIMIMVTLMMLISLIGCNQNTYKADFITNFSLNYYAEETYQSPLSPGEALEDITHRSFSYRDHVYALLDFDIVSNPTYSIECGIYSRNLSALSIDSADTASIQKDNNQWILTLTPASTLKHAHIALYCSFLEADISFNMTFSLYNSHHTLCATYTPYAKDCVLTAQSLAFSYQEDHSYTFKALNDTTETQLIIPESINNIPVTCINDYALKECVNLESVTLPDSIVSVGDYVFDDCVNLNYNSYDEGLYIGSTTNPYLILVKATSQTISCVTVQKNCRFIMNNAFENCVNLTDVILPDGLISIGSNAFYNCLSITTISLPASLKRLGASAFYNCHALKDINLPSNIEYIGAQAWKGCESLTYNSYDTGLYLGNDQNNYVALVGVTSSNLPTSLIHEDCRMILDYAFTSTNISYLTIPDNVTFIGDYAFKECLIEQITLPNTLTYLGQGTFKNCNRLTAVTLPDSLTILEDETFYDCSELSTLNLSNNLTYIGKYSLYNCTNLVTLDLPNSLLSIDSYALEQCISLKSMTIPHQVCYLGSYALAHCSRLTDITLPASLTSLLPYTFYNCNSLKNISLPTAMEDISIEAFIGCDSLAYHTYDKGCYLGNDNNPYLVLCDTTVNTMTSISIHPDCQNILNNALYGCSYLEKITIPSGVKHIGDYAFSYCSTLKSVTMGNNVLSIGDFAFANDYALKTITLSQSLMTLGEQVFCNCGLVDLTIPNSVVSLGDYALYSCHNLKTLTLSHNVSELAPHLLENCSALKKLTLGANITVIEDSACFNCLSLTQIDFKGTMIEWSAIDKKDNWINNSQDIIITCSDGELVKS